MIPKLLKSLRYLLIVTVLTIGLVEVGFRVAVRAGWFGLDYGDVFSQKVMNEGGFLLPQQRVRVVNGYGQKVSWITNSKGFRNDQEFDYNQSDSVVRILSIGDSFTSGYKVGQNETYSAILERELNARQDGLKYEVMVACVQNPLQGLDYLNKYGLKYKPDFVLLGITLGNDLSEIFLRLHALGHSKLEGTWVLENPDFDDESLQSQMMTEKLPSDTYYPASEISDYYDRLIFPKLLRPLFYPTYGGESIFAIKGKISPYIHDFTHGLGVYLKNQPESISTAFERLEEILSAYKELAEIRGFDFHIGLFPQRFQVNDLDQRETIKDYHLNADAFDWQAPNRIIGKYCAALDLHCIDPLEEFRKQSDILYLPNGDMHWNAKGQKVMAKAFLNEIWLE